jgi:hypothetical protein
MSRVDACAVCLGTVSCCTLRALISSWMFSSGSELAISADSLLRGGAVRGGATG